MSSSGANKLCQSPELTLCPAVVSRQFMSIASSAADVTVGQQRSDDDSVGPSSCSVRAGTVAELIAQGPAPACAACTLAGRPGFFFQRGWTAVCSIHNALAQSGETVRSFAAPPVSLPPQPRVQNQPPRPVTSITARWRQQISMKTQQRKKVRRLKKRASGESVQTKMNIHLESRL